MSLLTNLVAYWKLDESSGNPADASGNGNTLSNNGTVGFSAGVINNGANFGSGKYFSIADTNFNPTGDFTVSMWIKRNASGTHQCLAQDVSGDRKLYIRPVAGNLQFTVNDAWGIASSVDPDIYIGTWFHLVCVFVANGTSVMYFNAGSVGTAGSTPSRKNASGSGLTIGRRNYGGAEEYLNGSLDEIGWWDRALTPTEVSQLYNGGAGLAYPLTVSAPPTVTTQAVSAIDKTTATGNGNVTSDGGATITERGVCIGASANPDTSGTKFTTSGTTGAFTASITGLTPGAHYHVRAYAINSQGTSYGADVEFTAKNDVTVTKSLAYKVRVSLSAITKSLKYTTRSSHVAITKSLKYTVKKSLAAITKSSRYAVHPAITITKSAKYTVKAAHAAVTKSMKYTVDTYEAPIQKSLKYTIKTTPATITKSERYAIGKANTVTKSLRYAIKTNSSISKGLVYRITKALSNTKSLKYTVKSAHVAVTKSLQYATSKANSRTLGLSYEITSSHSSIQKSLKYSVFLPGNSITKDLEYVVSIISTAVITKSLRYGIKKSGTISKSLQYVLPVIAHVTIQKSLKYIIVGQSNTIQKSLQYVVRIYPYSKKKSPYTPFPKV